jgi:hypothetical protein
MSSLDFRALQKGKEFHLDHHSAVSNSGGAIGNATLILSNDDYSRN